MYKCMDCDLEFNIEEVKTKKICFEQEFGVANLFGTRTMKEVDVCPHCNSIHIEEMEECERCGSYEIELNQGLCDCCYGDLYE